MSSFRNLLLLCSLACFIIVGFCLLTGFDPAAVSSQLPTSAEVLSTTTSSGSYSSVAVILGIIGLVYLKIIWKLIHFDSHFPNDH